jgi:hypothetical protein
MYWDCLSVVTLKLVSNSWNLNGFILAISGYKNAELQGFHGSVAPAWNLNEALIQG